MTVVTRLFTVSSYCGPRNSCKEAVVRLHVKLIQAVSMDITSTVAELIIILIIYLIIA